MFRCLAKRGIDALVLLPLKGVYAQMQRVYRLRGSCSSLWTCANGILQGCFEHDWSDCYGRLFS